MHDLPRHGRSVQRSRARLWHPHKRWLWLDAWVVYKYRDARNRPDHAARHCARNDRKPRRGRLSLPGYHEWQHHNYDRHAWNKRTGAAIRADRRQRRVPVHDRRDADRIHSAVCGALRDDDSNRHLNRHGRDLVRRSGCRWPARAGHSAIDRGWWPDARRYNLPIHDERCDCSNRGMLRRERLLLGHDRSGLCRQLSGQRIVVRLAGSHLHGKLRWRHTSGAPGGLDGNQRFRRCALGHQQHRHSDPRRRFGAKRRVD